MESPVAENLAQETVQKEMCTAICVEKSETCEVGSSVGTVRRDTCTETDRGMSEPPVSEFFQQAQSGTTTGQKKECENSSMQFDNISAETNIAQIAIASAKANKGTHIQGTVQADGGQNEEKKMKKKKGEKQKDDIEKMSDSWEVETSESGVT